MDPGQPGHGVGLSSSRNPQLERLLLVIIALTLVIGGVVVGWSAWQTLTGDDPAPVTPTPSD
jgi:hypothetical protein